MSNSYRIRTTVGVDKSIRVKLDQDFESLEVLSIKVLQSDVYNRRCSDYGVIIGRVSINNGFGVPNAKVSVFVPLSDDDEINNPIIADLYPYKNLTKLNGDGFLYNLLPTEPSYSNHVPTGSFFTRQDVLTNPTKIEIYDKYYKYNSVTNESGDYMILGVPLGVQTVVVNIDLSDIGEFSLSPQDMIRMGVATPQQVDGTKFKSSSNLNELPQIITINRNIAVEPFWGDENVCEVGITRTDFDLSAEKNINIQPTSIFMGSVISSNEDHALKLKCKPVLKSGSLCSLVTGPGQIQAIRQTIKTDINGRPALEVASFEEGGQVIDDNGTWLFDVPMNLDYVVTNEFGEQVLSNDPKKGIPTKGRYRFKVMWNQPTDLGGRIKRANFLVPNIKEYGWTTPTGNDPLTGRPAGSSGKFGNVDNPCDYNSTLPLNDDARAAKASYAFSLDWDDYGETDNLGNVTPLGQSMILEAINCQDRFFEMQYNKVYTVSQLISEFRRGDSNNRIIAIKNILDDTCESTNNKFPSNDGMYRIDIIFILFQILMIIAYVILFIVIFVFHLYMWVLCKIILPIMRFLRDFWCWLATVGFDNSFFSWHPFDTWANPKCTDLDAKVKNLEDKCANTTLPLPNMTYPDCELCVCDPEEPKKTPPDPNDISNQSSNSAYADVTLGAKYIKRPYNSTDSSPGSFTQWKSNDYLYISGVYSNGTSQDKGNPGSMTIYAWDSPPYIINSADLPWHERFNLFNVKAKYFDSSSENPGGGVNRIGVRFNTGMNGGDLTTSSTLPNTNCHMDNVIAVVMDASEVSTFSVGNMFTTVDPTKSQDKNLSNVIPSNDLGTNSITGKTIGVPYNGDPKINVETITLQYADPTKPFNNTGQGSNLSTTYKVTGSSETTYHKFNMDLEYFQVIHNESLSKYVTDVLSLGPNLKNSFYTRVINGGYKMTATLTQDFYGGPGGALKYTSQNYHSDYYSNLTSTKDYPIRKYFKDSDNLRVVFFVRGVDPNSPKTRISYDLSRLYGQSTFGKKVVTLDNMRMNVPVQGGVRCVKHNGSSVTSVKDPYSNVSLFHDTFMWKPAANSPAFGPDKDPNTFFDANGDPQTPSDYNPADNDPFYRPPGYCDFKSFTTTAYTYYSYIDEDFGADEFNKPSNFNGTYDKISSIGKGVRIYGNASVSNNGNGGNVLATYIGKQKDYNFSNTDYDSRNIGTLGIQVFDNDWTADDGTDGQVIVDKKNRGYFNKEIIEGGNYASSRLIENTPGILGQFGVVSGRAFVPSRQGDCQGYGCPTIFNCCSYYYYTATRLGHGTGFMPHSYCIYRSYTYKSVGVTNSITVDSGASGRQIVMRSDRLPSSSSEEINKGNKSISYTLMANNNFTYFQIGDDGSAVQTGGGSSVSGVGNSGDSAAANAESTCADILSTFTCEGLIPLDCYFVHNNNFTFVPRDFQNPIPNNKLKQTITNAPVDCWGNRLPVGSNTEYGVQPEPIFTSGCYQLVTVPFETLKLDYKLLTEWRARMVITFAACRNVFSHYFTNNWINGTLYAFSFKNSRRFTSPTEPIAKNRNKPYNCYCKNNIYFNQDSNNFYYRSSPYNPSDNSFVGRKNPKNWFTRKEFGGNVNNLMFPTTVLDMGPRDSYTQEIVFSNDYDGYVMKNLDTTTFKDVSDLLNTFIISRLINKSMLDKILAVVGVGQVLTYFSRKNLKIDGDYAQMVSINSELGTVGFSDENYDSCTDVFYNGVDSSNCVIGIYYSSNTQIRDYVTPKRTIITDESTIDKQDCAFEYFKVRTQSVPYYQWFIKPNYKEDKDFDSGKSLYPANFPADSIFGSQYNDWSTEPYSATTFFSYGYQNLDRLLKSSRYFRTKGSLITKYYRGNIYSVGNSTPPSQSGDTQFWDVNTPGAGVPQAERIVNTGAPFYFYFGLNQGKSAFDRFTRKWIDTDVLTD